MKEKPWVAINETKRPALKIITSNYSPSVQIQKQASFNLELKQN